MTGFPRVCASALPILGLVFAVFTGSGRAHAQTPAPAPTIRTAITAAPRDPAPAATIDPASIPPADPAATLDPSVTPAPGATPVPGAPSGEVADPAGIRTISGVEPGADRTLALPAFTGEPGTAFSDEAKFQALSPLRRAWFLREYLRMRGDAPAAEKATEALIDLRIDAGLENASAIGAALAAEARTLLSQAKKKEAVGAATAATRIAPDLAGAWTTLARAQLSSGSFGPTFVALREAAGAGARNLRTRLRVVGNAGLALLIGTWIAWVTFLVLALGRYLRFIAHDFRHALADNMPGWIAAIILLPFLAFPIVFGGGVVALLAWWSVILWIKLTAKERIACAAFLVFGAASPFLFERLSTGFAFESGDASRLFSAVREDEIGTRELAEITAFADESKDPDTLITLGITHQRAGRYSRAREMYERAKEAGATVPALIGLGIVHYASGEIPLAIASFQKALAEDAGSLAAQFNLSQIHAERTDLSNSTTALEAAKHIDAKRCEIFIRRMLPPARKMVPSPDPATPPLISAAYVNRFLMVHPVPDAKHLARAKAAGGEMATRSWTRVSPAIPLHGVTWVFGAALALCLLFSAAFRSALPSRPCPRCGRSLCLRCDGPPLDGDLCVQCYHAFVDNEGVDPRQRAEKEREIERWRIARRRRRKMLSFFVPGSGHVLAGETGRGVTLLLIASIAVIRLVFWRGWFRPLSPIPGSVTPIVATALAGVVLLIAWVASLRMKTPEERGA